MASAAMALQEQHGSHTSDKISLESNTTDEGVQLKEQFITGDDFALKARKPYTISKQRERWTEEEHTRFLEALKLYGRAWKKIEEHVGTKTAVQIRSHAQKFFSKIVRESNNGDATDAKAIEIPPPRPKRKPMRPYPRKQAKTGISMPEKLIRSESQDSSTSEQENQSPVSVLSANSSDVSVRADSCTPNGSLSPVSSAHALHSCSIFGSEVPKMTTSDDEMKVMSDVARSQPGNTAENPNPDEEVPLKLELLSENNDFVQEDQSGVQFLKLFGKTLLVKNHSEDACSPAPLPWLSLSTQELHSPIPIKARLCEKKQKLDKNKEKEISSSASNSDLSRERSWDVDSLPSLVEKQPETSFNFSKLSKRSLDKSEDCRKGFVPCKRRLPEQLSGVSSTVIDEEQQRRVCL